MGNKQVARSVVGQMGVGQVPTNVHIYLFIKLYGIISQETVILRYDHYAHCTFIVFLTEIAC